MRLFIEVACVLSPTHAERVIGIIVVKSEDIMWKRKPRKYVDVICQRRTTHIAKITCSMGGYLRVVGRTVYWRPHSVTMSPLYTTDADRTTYIAWLTSGVSSVRRYFWLVLFVASSPCFPVRIFSTANRIVAYPSVFAIGNNNRLLMSDKPAALQWEHLNCINSTRDSVTYRSLIPFVFARKEKKRPYSVDRKASYDHSELTYQRSRSKGYNCVNIISWQNMLLLTSLKHISRFMVSGADV